MKQLFIYFAALLLLSSCFLSEGDGVRPTKEGTEIPGYIAIPEESLQFEFVKGRVTIQGTVQTTDSALTSDLICVRAFQVNNRQLPDLAALLLYPAVDVDDSGTVSEAELRKILSERFEPAYGSSSGDENWDAVLDTDFNGVIDVDDFAIFGEIFNFSQEEIQQRTIAGVLLGETDLSQNYTFAMEFNAPLSAKIALVAGECKKFEDASSTVINPDHLGVVVIDLGSGSVYGIRK